VLGIARMTKHDRYVEELRSRIEDRYDEILVNHKVYVRKRIIAEADLVGVKGNRADIYEVKCSFRPTKAKAQLRKLKRIFSHSYSVGSLFFYPANTEQLYRYTER
jgi:hypothetical protein